MPARLYLLDARRVTCYIFCMALIFLKLGGSLITDKTRPYTARVDKIEQLAAEISSSLNRDPSLQILLGHGSGSFGHQPASRYNTRRGVSGADSWRGFTEVWYQASELNRIVAAALRQAGLPALTLSPAASVTARDGKPAAWDVRPLLNALSNGLLPVIHGDVAFDETLGGTILSTESLFSYLAPILKPFRILLAGSEEGVWADFPKREVFLDEITPDSLPNLLESLGGAAGADVTGGMRSKVTDMIALVEVVPGLEVQIFSAEDPDTLGRALAGKNPGTRLHR
jgi:isopentenyl phosphate kinase